jgi:hypothetical protein
VAKELHYEVILCEDDGTWSSLYVLSRTKKDIEELIETDMRYRKVVHHLIMGPDDGWNWPTEEGFEPVSLLKKR